MSDYDCLGELFESDPSLRDLYRDAANLAPDLHNLADDIADRSRHTEEEGAALALEAADRLDMRAVVIVEFWAMMAGGLPYAWHWAPSPLTSRSIKPLRCAMHATGADVPSRADWSVDDIWAAEYAARPRMEGA